MKKAAIFIFLIILFNSCTYYPEVTIAVSKAEGSVHYEQYGNWLRSMNPAVKVIDLYFEDREEALEVIKSCDGVILSGGPDVHPAYYGKGYDTARCSIDLYRDSLEFWIIEEAIERNLPILGICRGEQILNVAMGGTLIVDIPEDFSREINHRCDDKSNCFHEVRVVEGTLLAEISGVTEGVVNSNHHQAVDQLSEQFRPTAYTKDNLIEAYEWSDPAGKPFMIAVQWHPERLGNENPLSGTIGRKFIEAAVSYSNIAKN